MIAFILLAVVGLSTSHVFAAGGSIARVNYYPQDQKTYDSVDYFLMQITAVNANTTVSVSIDGGTPIPLTYQGPKSATISGDTVPCDWYKWQTTVPAITTPGKHTFQFLNHYYVWQEPDKYWAEFNAYSDMHSFMIASNPPGLSPSPDPTSSKPTPPPIAAPSEEAMIGILASTTVAIATSVIIQRHYLAKKTPNKPKSTR
jgi:hypothetical protein